MLVFPENSCVCIVTTTRWTFKERVWLFENPSLFLLGGRGCSRPWAMAWWSREDSSLRFFQSWKMYSTELFLFLGHSQPNATISEVALRTPEKFVSLPYSWSPQPVGNTMCFFLPAAFTFSKLISLSPYEFSCPKYNSVNLSNAGVETIVLGLLWEGNCARCRRKELSSRRWNLRCSEGDKLKCCGLGWEDVQGVQGRWAVGFESSVYSLRNAVFSFYWHGSLELYSSDSQNSLAFLLLLQWFCLVDGVSRWFLDSKNSVFHIRPAVSTQTHSLSEIMIEEPNKRMWDSSSGGVGRVWFPEKLNVSWFWKRLRVRQVCECQDVFQILLANGVLQHFLNLSSLSLQ